MEPLFVGYLNKIVVPQRIAQAELDAKQLIICRPISHHYCYYD